MDRTSWKPRVFKATEAVDYKAEEEGTSDGAKKGWLTRQRGGSAEEPKKDFTPIDWAGQVGATKSEADQDKASDLMDKYYELVNEPMEDLPSDGSAMEERRSIHAKGVADFKSYLESSGSATVNQDVTDILEDENYHSLNKMLTKEEPETQSSRDKEFYDESTQNTLDTLNQSKVNGFPFFSYVGQPEKIISDGKGGIILYGMKRNPNSIRRIDVKYDEGRDTYTVSFMSNRNKPKGEYNDVYFDQLGGLIAGNKGLGVESYAKENYKVFIDNVLYRTVYGLEEAVYIKDETLRNHGMDAEIFDVKNDQFIDVEDTVSHESKANEDDHKKSWDELDSIAKKGFSDIGYDQKSWDSEPKEVRAEMETVVKDNMSKENWKDVANKFYNEELNKGKKIGGESTYGYGSVTGRMSPVEAWNQGADVYGEMGYDPSLRNPIFQDFRRLKWNELPTDIQEAWKSELGYYTQGEGLADDIEKQLNRFGVNLDRDPEQVEEAHEAYFVEWGYDLDYDFAEINDIDEAKQKAEAEGGNVYLNDQLVYSVIPSIKKDPTNDKSNFIMGNHVMDVESKANEGMLQAKCFSCDNTFKTVDGSKPENCPKCGSDMIAYSEESLANEEIIPDWNYHADDNDSDEEPYDDSDDLYELMRDQQRDEEEKTKNESKASEGIYEEYVNKFGDNQSLGGGFGDALRANDLELAFSRADTDNYNKLKELGYAWTGNESKASEEYSAWDIEHAVMDDLKSFTLEWVKNNQHGGGHYNETVHVDERHAVEEIKKQFVAIAQNSYDGFETSNVAHGILSSLVSEGKLKWLGSGDGIFGGGVGYQASEGFNQGLYGYVDAKCKTCGIEFDSIPDMDDHYAMNSDHVSNLNDLDSDIPNSD